jgi:hypothetical protein
MKRIWMALPKYICWGIWIAQNKAIFQEEKKNPKRTTNKVISLMCEHMGFMLKQSTQILDLDEQRWLSKFQLASI